jgi:predicted pyridoxine 5'-phosphate oxidase superfamily flavin-nucleotide-binding protein
VVEGDDALIAQLMPDGYEARPEQAILFTVAAWDINCSQHIPQRVDAAAFVARDRRIGDLEAEVARLRAAGAAAI